MQTPSLSKVMARLHAVRTTCLFIPDVTLKLPLQKKVQQSTAKTHTLRNKTLRQSSYESSSQDPPAASSATSSALQQHMTAPCSLPKVRFKIFMILQHSSYNFGTQHLIHCLFYNESGRTYF